MEKTREEIIDETLKKPPLGPDDKFRFWCTACGKCCCNSEGIILSPSDIFRGSKYLGLTPEAFTKQYCFMFVGMYTHLPLFTVKTEGRQKRCVFLDDRNKCRIHHAKPGVCEIYPLARGVSAENPDIVEYRLTPVKCGKRCKEFTVREWLSVTGFDESNALYFAWDKRCEELIPWMQKLHEQYGEGGFSRLAPYIASLLYLQYDTDKEFIPQFDENGRTLIRILESTSSEAELISEMKKEERL